MTGSSSALGVTLANSGYLALSHPGAEVGPVSISGANASAPSPYSNGVVIAADINGGNHNAVSLSHVVLSDDPQRDGLPATITTGPLRAQGANLVIGGTESPDAILSVSGGASLAANDVTDFSLIQDGSTPSADFSQLQATGNVSLGGQLNLSEGGDGSGNCLISIGDTATVVTTSGTLSGTFANAVDGATIPVQSACTNPPAGGLAAVIHYTANSVTATVVAGGGTSTTLSASPTNPNTNQTVTLSAQVTDGTPLYAGPAGTVAFRDGTQTIAGCSAVKLTASNATTGSATCTTSFATAGSAQLTATFTPSPGSVLTGSTSAPLGLTIAGSTGTGPGPGTATGTLHLGAAKVKGTSASIPVSCSGKASCTVMVTLTAVVTSTGGKVVAVTARRAKAKKRTVTLGSVRITLGPGQHKAVVVKLNSTGRRLLAKRHTLPVKLTVSQMHGGKWTPLHSHRLTFRVPKRKR